MKITYVEERNTKLVEYYGTTFHVPLNVDYIATDKDGSIFGYTSKPEYNYDQWYVSSGLFLGSCDLEDTDWETTLVEYTED